MEWYFYMGWPLLLALGYTLAAEFVKDPSFQALATRRRRFWLLFQLLWIFLGGLLVILVDPPHVN